MFFIMGSILIIEVFWLINRLKKKREQVFTGDGRANFNKEICVLWMILGTFSMSYLIRGVWDTFVWARLGKKYIYTL